MATREQVRTRTKMQIAYYLRQMGANWEQAAGLAGYPNRDALRRSWIGYVKRNGPPPWPDLADDEPEPGPRGRQGSG